MSFRVFIPTSFLCLILTGCQLTSKYALDDADYAEKYDVPYEDGEKVFRMGKQVVDARHVEGKSGVSFGAGFANNGEGAAAGDISLFGYPVSWAEYRLGLSGVYAGSEDQSFLGGHVGTRLQPPSRVAPFAGLGSFVGFAGQGDDCGCDDDSGQAFVSVYPEVGIHFWMTGRSRLSFSSQYWLNTQGRDADFWLHTVSYSILER